MAKGRVLLAHGNADCRKIYGSVLTFDGYDVEVVSEGDRAMQLLAALPFDAVVTDLYLPSAVDECLVRQIRAQVFSSHLPVVVISGWTTDLHQELARSEGADIFLPLPLRPRDLLGVVEHLLEQSKGPFTMVTPSSVRPSESVVNGH
jgi:DNA-binding response OmpR family regulator